MTSRESQRFQNKSWVVMIMEFQSYLEFPEGESRMTSEEFQRIIDKYKNRGGSEQVDTIKKLLEEINLLVWTIERMNKLGSFAEASRVMGERTLLRYNAPFRKGRGHEEEYYYRPKYEPVFKDREES